MPDVGPCSLDEVDGFILSGERDAGQVEDAAIDESRPIRPEDLDAIAAQAERRGGKRLADDSSSGPWHQQISLSKQPS